MFELDKYEPRLHQGNMLSPEETYEPTCARDLRAISLLVWAEHCIECAAPACFKTCDLYQPRPDKRCRRFLFGIHKNVHFRSLRGYGAEVVFKKWGKLEARGNTYLLPVENALQIERAAILSSPLANLFGSATASLVADERWNWLTHSLEERLTRWLHHRRKRSFGPDAFLLEVYNPSANAVKLQLVMTVAKEASAGAVSSAEEPSFRATLTLRK